MKHKNFIFAVIILLSLAIYSCKTINAAGDKSHFVGLTQKIDSLNYTFVPSTANPSGGRMIPLSSEYLLRLSNDSIISYLPYFGRIYVAPMGASESGIKFVSTQFSYKTEKNKNGWEIRIKTIDTSQPYELKLNMDLSGYGTLSVNQPNRQPISFYGTIE